MRVQKPDTKVALTYLKVLVTNYFKSLPTT